MDAKSPYFYLQNVQKLSEKFLGIQKKIKHF